MQEREKYANLKQLSNSPEDVTVRDLHFYRTVVVPEVYLELRELEKQFSWTDKQEEPGRWLQLEKELGVMYRRIMGYYRV